MHDIVTYFMLMGALSTTGELPFWATANRGGIMPDGSGAVALASARSSFDESRTFQWQWAASAAVNYAQDLQPVSSHPELVSSHPELVSGSPSLSAMIDELYISARWKVLRADVGMQRREREFTAGETLKRVQGDVVQGDVVQGDEISLRHAELVSASPIWGSLSSTEGHIVESNNARPMPGIRLSLEPVAVPWTGGHLKIWGSWGDYMTLDDRYVDGALVHRVRGYLRYDISEHWFVQAGLDHYAIWGGTSPEYGVLPVTFENYLRVATGLKAGSGGPAIDRENVLGDQGGAEQLRLGWKGNGKSVTFQYEKPYNDKSGMKFANMPDGVYTLHLGFDDKSRWISDIVLEGKYTMWQSGTFHDPNGRIDGNAEYYGGYYLGCDNYFWNGEFKSGWTHYGRTICDPQFYTGEVYGVWSVYNTRFKAVHLGIGGKLFHVAPYRLMVTQSWNYGSYWFPYVGESTFATTWKWWQRNTVDKPLAQFCLGLDAALPLHEISRIGLPLSIVGGLYLDHGRALGNSFATTIGLSLAL